MHLVETLRLSGGELPLASRHWQRLARSARELGWPAPPPADWWLHHTRAATGLAHEGRVRWTWDPHGEAAVEVGPLPEDLAARKRGVAAFAVPGPRPRAAWKLAPRPFENAALAEARRRAGATRVPVEALFVDATRNVLEGARTNLWVWTGTELRTPPATRRGVGVLLAGVARAWLVETLSAAGVVVREAPVKLDELHDAAAAFLSNALVGLVPVLSVDARPLARVEVSGAVRWTRTLPEWMRPAMSPIRRQKKCEPRWPP